MNNWWVVLIGLCCVLLGFAIGTGLGMQKGQYMLFEGLEGIFEGSEININLNETELVNRITGFYEPYFDEMLEETKPGYVVSTYTVKPYSVVYVWSEGVIDCKEYINKSHSSLDTTGNILMDEVVNPTNESITCKYWVNAE